MEHRQCPVSGGFQAKPFSRPGARARPLFDESGCLGAAGSKNRPALFVLERHDIAGSDGFGSMGGTGERSWVSDLGRGLETVNIPDTRPFSNAHIAESKRD